MRLVPPARRSRRHEPCPAPARRSRTAALSGAVALILLLSLVPAGTVRAELPPPGTDVMNVAMSIDICLPPGPCTEVSLFGTMSILRGAGTPDMIPLQISALTLDGTNPVLGRVHATLDPTFGSGGQVAMTPGGETPADSFFDVWVDISLPDQGRSFQQGDWYMIQSRTTAIPFFDVFSENSSESVPLIDQATGAQAGTLTHMALDPHPRINRLTTQAQLDWTLNLVREVVTLNGESLVVASETFSNPGPIQSPMFNTELVMMNLSGATPVHGPLTFLEQVAVHSPGQTTAANPGPTQFPADSFFDSFFDISFNSGGAPSPQALNAYINLAPVVGRATVNGWPPLGALYSTPVGSSVPVFNKATGAQSGRINSFQWSFTQSAGGCVDADGDGVFAPPCGTDCDDTDPKNFPGNLEDCFDGRDNNCNLLIDCRDPVCTGRPCDDGDRCTRPDVCTATGVCVGQTVNCDDHNPCTLDRCNPVTGLCENVPVNCDDQNPCTADSCSAASGQCVHNPISCDDNNPCTQDFCTTAGGCQHNPLVGATCSDGDPCTQGDKCVQVAGGVVCQGTPANCDDGNSCTRDFCDPATGQCRHDPLVGDPCDDGNRCTQGDHCVQGPVGPICVGTPANCDDQDPCTADSCDPATGLCVHVATNCDDQDPCTIDKCDPTTGQCQHTPIVCDDGNDCTQDSCDPASGQCRHVPLVGQVCDDGNDCTQDDHCVQATPGGVVCQGTPVNCDDQNPCTQDHCEPSGCIVPDEGSGHGTAEMPPRGCGYASENNLQILNGLPVGTSIDIKAIEKVIACTPVLNFCTFMPISAPADCDTPGGDLGGEKECADNSAMEMHLTGTGALAGFSRNISLTVGVEEHAAPRTPFDPVQSFNAEVFALTGQLAPGDPDFDLLRITAGNRFGLPSPGHTILSQVGPNWAVDSFFDITYRIDFVGHAGGPLSGMSGSTTGTARFRTAPGGCVHTPVDCDDQNPCTLDRCNPTTGACEHPPLNCDDGNQCTKDSCDLATGACKHDPQPGAACDDGNACTQNDVCVQGPAGGIGCQGTPVSCDDQNPCTFDSCNPLNGLCVHVANTCDDGNACTADSCNPATGACDHRPIPLLEPNPINFRDQTTISWSPTPDATHWNTYRGSVPMFMLGTRLPGPVYDQACFESDDSAANGPTIAVDTANPPLGRAFYYLVSGEGACGESILGSASDGTVIPNTAPCPTPP